jgi:hypothetical protein
VARVRRSIAERALAWAYTGPLGHLWSVVGDLAAYGGRSLARRRR